LFEIENTAICQLHTSIMTLILASEDESLMSLTSLMTARHRHHHSLSSSYFSVPLLDKLRSW